MARRRYISTEISIDPTIMEVIEECGEFAGLLYTWMVPHAEDDGTITSDPRKLLYQVIPGLRARTAGDVADAVDAMIRLGLLERWGDDRLAFPFESFYRYQSYIKEGNRRTSTETCETQPPTPVIDDEQRTTPENTGERRESPENTVSVPPSFPVPSPNGDAPDAAAPATPTPIPAKRDKPARQTAPRAELQAMWQAFVDETGQQPIVDGERGKWNGGLRELWAGGIRAPDLPPLIAAYRRHYGAGVDCNPRAMANNLSTLQATRASPAERVEQLYPRFDLGGGAP